MSDASTPVSYRVLAAPDSSLGTVLGATERLQQSRRLLRDHMQALNASATAAQSEAQHRPSAWLTAIPLLGPVLGSLSAWWAKHPLRVVADLFASSTASAAKPMTQARPWSMLLMAVAVGGLLVWTRPWRFAWLRRAVYAGVMPKIVSTLVSRLPTEGWLDIVNALLRRPGAAAQSAQATTPTRADPAPPERSAPPQPTWGHGPTPNTSLH